MINSLRRLFPDPFILILFATVCVASLFPASGVVGTAINALATAAIVLLFFLHGAKLSRENVLQAVRHWRLHLTILTLTFVLFPVLGFALSQALPRALSPEFWQGILFLCALPSTVQSSIAFTSIARGNVAATVASAAASNLLAIGLTPVIISLLTSAHGNGVSLSGVSNIVLQMLLPFVLGHLCRPWIGAWAARRKALLSITDRGTIVLAVYSAFSAAVLGRLWDQVPPATLAMLILICGVLLAAVLLLARGVAALMGFTREDQISIVFCGSKKSLVSGVPMARVLFAGPHVGAAILPLMIFHQLQLIVCAWLARRYASDPSIMMDKTPQEIDRAR
jgi:sodium/bile acid cotransporter 7